MTKPTFGIVEQQTHWEISDGVGRDTVAIDTAAIDTPAIERVECAGDADVCADSAAPAFFGQGVPFPNPLRHPLLGVAWCIRFVFGVVSLVVFLAVVAAVPVLHIFALGYLLDVEGEVARTGRWRSAFGLLTVAPRLGAIALGLWLWMIPLRFLADAASDARLIEPGSPADRTLHRLVAIAAVLIAIHLCLALARGGRLMCFFRPIKNVRWLAHRFRERNYWRHAERGIREFLQEFRVRHRFWLGLRGFLGAAAWLFPPTALFAVSNGTTGGAFVVTLVGGLLLMIILSWLPFLQAHYAAENRLRAMFELGRVRELYRRAPLAWSVALIVAYTLALPLYLFKVVLPPSDAMWGVTLVFIASIYPARVVAGWAYHRAVAKPDRAGWWWRWLGRAAIIPAVGVFVFVLYFTQFIGEHGKRVLFEHHALLLPVPF